MEVTNVTQIFKLGFLDIAVFLAFVVFVVALGIFKGRKEETSEDYFLASRGLNWCLIGFTLIAANISTEQFVGMSGSAAGKAGLAIASYEWIAAITLVFVAVFFLPKFLASGIYTIPEYLEYRYNAAARGIMALYTMIIYVGVTIAAVVYSGGITLSTIFAGNDIFGVPLTLETSAWFVGIAAATYVFCGGLKACAWADLVQGSALIAGGAVVMFFGLNAVGGPSTFFHANRDKLHMILPADNPMVPWTALVVGLWIPNFYYWGLNQYISQKTLAAKNLRQGQLGVIFAAALKLLIPFVVVIPGIMALQLYRDQMPTTTDCAYPLLIKNLIPIGVRGFILAALAGAVMSTLAAMLNSASTIFTMDIYKRHIKKDASQKSLVWMGRFTTLLFVVISCLIAPQLGNPKFQGIFTYIQEFQGYISPGILAAFVFGMIFKSTPPAAGIAALTLCVPIYGFLQWQFGGIAFLNRMAITFALLLIIMAIITILKPLPEPKKMPAKEGFDMKPASSVLWLGALVIIATLTLYVIFW
jgi:SSS family solute:Na+ symporter